MPDDDEERRRRAARERLRKALDGVDLDPQQTQDDVPSPRPLDQQLRDDVPPHHGTP